VSLVKVKESNLIVEASKPSFAPTTAVAVLSGEMDQDATFPSPEKQKQYIKSLNKDLEFKQSKGDSFFLISQKWWDQWKMFVNFDDAEDAPKEKRSKPNPIDNTDLLENGDLKRNLTEGVHYSILFEPVWKSFVNWYGISESSKSD
jgi:ubiquitin carboxyl-terminal hydrolase 4/11/15